MKTIDELPIALHGTWNRKLVRSAISLAVMKSKYTHVCTINENLEAFKLNNSEYYVIGFAAEIFDVNYAKLMERFVVVSDVAILLIGNEMPIPLYLLQRKDNPYPINKGNEQ
jgi:hypothetical protein